MQGNNISRAWHLLYYTYGLLPIIAGLDKYFHYIVNWLFIIAVNLLSMCMFFEIVVRDLELYASWCGVCQQVVLFLKQLHLNMAINMVYIKQTLIQRSRFQKNIM